MFKDISISTTGNDVTKYDKQRQKKKKEQMRKLTKVIQYHVYHVISTTQFRRSTFEFVLFA